MKVYLGVVDVGYVDDNGTTTTGDVAGYLEDRYHIMRTFLEMNEKFIHDQLVDEVAGLIESIAQGKPVSSVNSALTTRLAGRDISGDSFGNRIAERFRDALDSGEMHRILPMTQQVSDETLSTSSRKKAIKQNEQRQAFIDTGLYQASFRCWVGP